MGSRSAATRCEYALRSAEYAHGGTDLVVIPPPGGALPGACCSLSSVPPAVQSQVENQRYTT
jgi:hypothetical protein